MLSPSLGITKEIASRGPQVLDTEYQEPNDLSMAPEGPSFLHFIPHITSSNIHHIGLVLKWQQVLLHEVISLGIMVCIASIFKTFKRVALNLSGFHNVCLNLCSFPCSNLGGSHGALVSWLPFRIGCYLVDPYLPFSIFIPSIYPHFWALGKAPLGKSFILPHGKKGLKAKGEMQLANIKIRI
jgi:hypothetical protein